MIKSETVRQIAVRNLLRRREHERERRIRTFAEGDRIIYARFGIKYLSDRYYTVDESSTLYAQGLSKEDELDAECDYLRRTGRAI